MPLKAIWRPKWPLFSLSPAVVRWIISSTTWSLCYETLPQTQKQWRKLTMDWSIWNPEPRSISPSYNLIVSGISSCDWKLINTWYKPTSPNCGWVPAWRGHLQLRSWQLMTTKVGGIGLFKGVMSIWTTGNENWTQWVIVGGAVLERERVGGGNKFGGELEAGSGRSYGEEQRWIWSKYSIRTIEMLTA